MIPDRFCACNRGATAFVALMIPNGNCNGLSPNLWNFNVFPIKPVSVAIAPFRLTTQCCVRLASNFGNERHSAIRNVTLFCVSNLIFFLHFARNIQAQTCFQCGFKWRISVPNPKKNKIHKCVFIRNASHSFSFRIRPILTSSNVCVRRRSTKSHQQM